MAAIHVIYAPRTNILLPGPPMIEQLGLSVATLDIPGELTDEQIKETVEKLATMVLEASVPAPLDSVAPGA